MKCKYCKQKLKGFFNTRCVNPECPDYYVDGMGQNGVEFSSTKRMEKAKKVEGSSPSNKANRAMQDLKVVAENWTPTKPFVPIIHKIVRSQVNRPQENKIRHQLLTRKLKI